MDIKVFQMSKHFTENILVIILGLPQLGVSYNISKKFQSSAMLDIHGLN